MRKKELLKRIEQLEQKVKNLEATPSMVPWPVAPEPDPYPWWPDTTSGTFI